MTIEPSPNTFEVDMIRKQMVRSDAHGSSWLHVPQLAGEDGSGERQPDLRRV